MQYIQEVIQNTAVKQYTSQLDPIIQTTITDILPVILRENIKIVNENLDCFVCESLDSTYNQIKEFNENDVLILLDELSLLLNDSNLTLEEKEEIIEGVKWDMTKKVAGGLWTATKFPFKVARKAAGYVEPVLRGTGKGFNKVGKGIQSVGGFATKMADKLQRRRQKKEKDKLDKEAAIAKKKAEKRKEEIAKIIKNTKAAGMRGKKDAPSIQKKKPGWFKRTFSRRRK